MSGQLLLLNPKKRRSAAQKAATRRLVAHNRSKRRKNPISVSRPKRRHVYRAAKRRSNPITHAVRRIRRRRNPISMGSLRVGTFTSLIKTGAIGAGGAMAVDLVMGFLPLPASLTSRTDTTGGINYMYYATKTVAAVLLGTLGKKVLGSSATTMAEGSMVVNMYDFFRTMLAGSGINLGMYANKGVGAYTNRSVSGNVTRLPNTGMGAVSPQAKFGFRANGERSMYVK